MQFMMDLCVVKRLFTSDDKQEQIGEVGRTHHNVPLGQ